MKITLIIFSAFISMSVQGSQNPKIPQASQQSPSSSLVDKVKSMIGFGHGKEKEEKPSKITPVTSVKAPAETTLIKEESALKIPGAISTFPATTTMTTKDINIPTPVSPQISQGKNEKEREFEVFEAKILENEKQNIDKIEKDTQEKIQKLMEDPRVASKSKEIPDFDDLESLPGDIRDAIQTLQDEEEKKINGIMAENDAMLKDKAAALGVKSDDGDDMNEEEAGE